MPSLEGAVVAITGASSGIGWECALALEEAIRGLGGAALVMTTDVAEEERVRGFVDATLTHSRQLPR